MKSLYFFPFGIFLFIIGCESLFYDQDIQNPPSFEYLIQDISSELGLDYEQRNSARSSLERGRDFFPDPAALWELAKIRHRGGNRQPQNLRYPQSRLHPEQRP